MSNEVTTEIRDQIMIITLNRPDAMNAVNQALADQLASSLDDLDNNNAVSVGVLAGAGRGFCAGMDLKEFVVSGLPTASDRGFGGITERASKKPLLVVWSWLCRQTLLSLQKVQNLAYRKSLSDCLPQQVHC